MIIAQISDTHINLDTPDSTQRIRDFEAVIADINALDPQPDLIVHTGDIVHNGLAKEYMKVREIIADAKAPLYAMVGNKDNRTRMSEAFFADGYLSQATEFIEYSLNEWPVRLVLLDTLCEDSNKGDFCEKRAENIANLFGGDVSKPIAIFTHHPAFEVGVGPDPMHFETMEAMARLRESIQSSNRVIRVFSGHVHRATYGLVGNVPCSVMSAVATPLRRGDYPAHMEGRPTYQLHQYDGNSGFVTQTRIV